MLASTVLYPFCKEIFFSGLHGMVGKTLKIYTVYVGNPGEMVANIETVRYNMLIMETFKESVR